MRDLLRRIKRAWKVLKGAQAIEPAHIFIGADPGDEVIGIVLEAGEEEYEIRLQPHEASVMVCQIEEMLQKLE